MKRILTVAASLACIALPAAAQKPAPLFFYCVSTKIGEPTGYVSAPYTAPGADAAAIARDFRAYVQQRYSPEVPLGAGCYGFTTLADTDAARSHRIAALATKQAIVEVDWQNGAAASPARVAAAAPRAAGPASPQPPARPSATQSAASSPPATAARSGS